MTARLPSDLLDEVTATRRRWLVTGAAGFIGSHLAETLLALDQEVVGLDNFSTGSRRNVAAVRAAGGKAASRFELIEGDILDQEDCRRACQGVHVVLHQAALASVPRSIEQPHATHAANVTGFLNVLVAARDAGVRRVVYASSSAVYGDSTLLPKVEDHTGEPISPYAASKRADELYGAAFGRCYGLELVGLRYFNIFGARQDPEGAYAAVIPRWVAALLRGEPAAIHGDGETSRDFCPVQNAVQANLRAGLTARGEAIGRVYNVGVGVSTSLNQLFVLLRDLLGEVLGSKLVVKPVYMPRRPGDVLHSHADISKARELLAYDPTHDLMAGLREALPWYASRFAPWRASADCAPTVARGSSS